MYSIPDTCLNMKLKQQQQQQKQTFSQQTAIHLLFKPGFNDSSTYLSFPAQILKGFAVWTQKSQISLKFIFENDLKIKTVEAHASSSWQLWLLWHSLFLLFGLFSSWRLVNPQFWGVPNSPAQKSTEPGPALNRGTYLKPKSLQRRWGVFTDHSWAKMDIWNGSNKAALIILPCMKHFHRCALGRFSQEYFKFFFFFF